MSFLIVVIRSCRPSWLDTRLRTVSFLIVVIPRSLGERWCNRFENRVVSDSGNTPDLGEILYSVFENRVVSDSGNTLDRETLATYVFENRVVSDSGNTMT